MHSNWAWPCFRDTMSSIVVFDEVTSWHSSESVVSPHPRPSSCDNGRALVELTAASAETPCAAAACCQCARNPGASSTKVSFAAAASAASASISRV